MALIATIKSFSFATHSRATPLLADLCIQVDAGKVVGLVGPSGVGKSTFARLLAGLNEPGELFHGSVELDGEPVRQPESTVSLVIQDYRRAVFPWMTVRRNLQLGVRGRTANGLVVDAARVLGIEDLLDAHPHGLSGGQLQRVQVGRALVSGSKFIILDEATSSLDVAMRRSVYEQLDSIAHEQKVGILIVTHEIDEAVSIADTVLLMKRAVPNPTITKRAGLRGKAGQSLWTSSDDSVRELCLDIERTLSA